MEARIAARHHTAAINGAAAGPRRDDAASSLDHRDQRRDVVGLQPRLDDEIGLPGRDHAIGIAIGACSGRAWPVPRPKGRPPARCRKTAGARW